VKEISISVSVCTSDPEQATRAIEAFSRTAAGLALEGLQTNVSLVPLDETDTDE
jgi:hypothetical protein